MAAKVGLYLGDALQRYAFGDDHPFAESRVHAFTDELHRRGLEYQLSVFDPCIAGEAELLGFHTAAYLAFVRQHSQSGEGMLDYGDTPAFAGVYEAAATVVGSVLDATRRVMAGEIRRAFLPVGGLHHSMPDQAAGFCVFNDVGVAIRWLQRVHRLTRIAYIDIDAHHGDGIYYPFEDDPGVIFADIHEDGRYVYPRSGFSHEVGKGPARGRKLNIPLLPRSGDDEFLMMWDKVESFIDESRPEFIFLQCGADGLYGDPLAHLQYSTAAHERAALGACRLAEAHASGRLVALGGGGYDLRNVARAWATVVRVLLETPVRGQ